MISGLRWMTVTFVIAGAMGLPAKAAAAEDSFYTGPALFSTRPQAVNKYTQSIDRLGPVGIGIELLQPAFGMRIKNVEKGSPAAQTGRLRAGQIIESINGQKLEDIDPRIQLGNIITQAEASDGKVTLRVRDEPGAQAATVTVTIPVLGAYSDTWPMDCPKSDAIVRNLAARFKKEGYSGNIGLDGPKMLFMLSTGEEQDLEVVRGWVRKVVRQNRNYGERGLPYQWHVSWGAPPLAEYYLRTGDPSVLPLMKKIADAVTKTQYQGGWGGRGLAGHHMGLAGTGTLTFLMLARQCGVEVDEQMLQSALQHYYRFAGRGTNPYMDHPPESTFTDNGRNARLAFAMAAASKLRPEDEESLYAQARDISAIKSFYSTSYMLHGHTGGGIGEVWRSAAMGLMYDKKPRHYREFMNQRRWFYDLSRRYNGSFGILGGSARYDNPAWGITMGLTYTAPRKKLSIFGAPPSPHAKTHDAVPYRCWGTPADDAFLSPKPPAMPDGSVRSIKNESVASDTGLAVDRRMGNPQISDEEILKYIYHPEHRFREVAASAIRKHGRYHLIPGLLTDDDPRVRNAGVMACHAELFDPDNPVPGFARDKVQALLLAMLNDPDEAWFTTYKVLGIAGAFPVETLAPHAARLVSLLGHEEWWLRHGALEALFPLAAHKSTYRDVLPGIEKHLPNFIRQNWDLLNYAKMLKNAPAEVQKAGRETLGRVYLAYPGTNANPPGGVHPQSEQWVLNTMAYAIAEIPGGLETLFRVSKKRFPNETLVHREQFLSGGDREVPSEDMRAALETIIREELIPQHVGKNWDALKAFAEARNDNWVPMSSLQNLYTRAGVSTYNWQDYGPERNEMRWFYHSFDPPEQWVGRSDRLGRYREVTLPKGMKNWYTPDFDPQKAGWKRGLAPFGAADGEKTAPAGARNCSLAFCGCDDPIHTLWEDDVLLLRGTFEIPPLEEGYSYRLLHGGISHVGSGGGYQLYVNGKLFIEDTRAVDRRAGARPKGRAITKEWWPEFADGEVTLSAISFKKQHPRTKKYGGNITIFMQRMKTPPLNAKMLRQSATAIPMRSSEWQDLQDPDKSNVDPLEGTYRWDGRFEAKPELLGTWKLVDQVSVMENFAPGERQAPRLPRRFDSLELQEKGTTERSKWFWSGDTLMDLERYEALKMTMETRGGREYLFVEAGGFSAKRAADWTCPLLVFERQ